jgi:hypothetical protein
MRAIRLPGGAVHDDVLRAYLMRLFGLRNFCSSKNIESERRSFAGKLSF